MAKGILTQVISSHDPVFGKEPLTIDFDTKPILGESFIFYSRIHGLCNTSYIKAIDSEKPDTFVLLTRNSVYKLEVVHE
jgi:hypothetical protein